MTKKMVFGTNCCLCLWVSFVSVSEKDHTSYYACKNLVKDKIAHYKLEREYKFKIII